MTPDAVERRLAAILSADVAGYSRLMAEDEVATLRALEAGRRQITQLVGEHRGRVVDSPGDNLLAEFPSASEAVRCAVAIQGAARERNAGLPADRRMELRIGVHLGEVLVEDGRLYGDGVNVAARLEGLAEPGGVCLSGSVHEQVRRRLDLAFEDLGRQAVKNIPDPVQVFRIPVPGSRPRPRRARWTPLRIVGVSAVLAIVGLAAALALSWPRPIGWVLDLAGLSGLPVNPPLPDKPSLAVLPFTNMSDDPEQEYFSDGMTEDITTELSRSPHLFVIARNSAFTYKGQPVDVARIGRELGVRYVVEGSVRREAERLRITAQLIDASTGFHVWSERYDRELADVFALQTEIAERIMGAVGVEVRAAEAERARRKPIASLSAYDAYLRGWYLFETFTRSGFEQARPLLERAAELAPSYSSPLALLSSSYSLEYLHGWNRDPALLERARGLAQRALSLDPTDAQAHNALAGIHIARGEWAEGAEAARRAIEHDPNYSVPNMVLGLAAVREGRVPEALGFLRRALRLNPRAAMSELAGIGYIYYRVGRTQDAVRLWEQVRSVNSDLLMPRLMLVSVYEADGRHREARVVVEELLHVLPDLTVERAVEIMPPDFLDPEATSELRASLRAAGLPDPEPGF